MRRSRPKFSNWANLHRTLFASKVVNFCAYFRHLCIIEKRRLRILHSHLSASAELLVSYGSPHHATLLILRCLQSARRDSVVPSDAWPTDCCTQQLLACKMDLAFFAKFRTFWSITPLRSVPGQKHFRQNFVRPR